MKIILELKARHFYKCNFVGRNHYEHPTDEACPIERSFYETVGEPFMASLYGGTTDNTDKRFEFSKSYGNEFELDKVKAESHDWDDTVIRTIELTES